MWKEFRIAVSFLSRLPLTYKGEWDEKSFSRASVFYPVVGLIIGFCVAVVAFLLKLTGYYSVAAVGALITAICISGGIHLDGFMDMCDGIFASRGREKALEIMKDSRVGSFAVIGVVMLLLLKFALYFVLIGETWFFIAFLAAFAFSRFMMTCTILVFPSARASGLGATVKKYVAKPALLWGILIIFALSLWHGFYALIFAFILAFAIMILLAGQINRFLHGLTGDIYGAMAELGEAVFLLCLMIIVVIIAHFGISATLW